MDDSMNSMIGTSTGTSSTAIGGTLTIDSSNLTMNTSSLTWANSPISISSTPFTFSDSGSPSIHARGDVIVDGDLKIQGESIKELLEQVKDKLAIFTPNTELEERWDKLRELRCQYLELEKDILEKEEIAFVTL